MTKLALASCLSRIPAHSVELPPCLQAFLDNYKEFPMFHTSDGRKTAESLDEFDDARQVVAALSAEYEACEHSDYVRSDPLFVHVP